MQPNTSRRVALVAGSVVWLLTLQYTGQLVGDQLHVGDILQSQQLEALFNPVSVVRELHHSDAAEYSHHTGMRVKQRGDEDSEKTEYFQEKDQRASQSYSERSVGNLPDESTSDCWTVGITDHGQIGHRPRLASAS